MPSYRARAACILALAAFATGPGLLADTSVPAAAPGTAAAAAPAAAPVVASGPSPWVLGIARFGVEKSDDPISPLQDTIPLLMASDLKSLPARRTPEEAAAEAAALSTLRSRFGLGADLATKLDARALRFFDPILDVDAWKDGISAAEKQVSAAAEKLKESGTDTGAAPPKPPAEQEAKLWDGYAKGQLIDSPSLGPAQAAKAAKADLLVTGSVDVQSGYAAVRVRGYDAALDREVFSWKSFCAVDDPAPLAADFAKRLERWTAGRDFARLEVKLSPSSAELAVDGEPFDGEPTVIYVYHDERLSLAASAAGYSPRAMKVDLALGEDKSVDLQLEPLATGNLDLTTDPSGAAISLDSVPMGRSPITIALDGSRRVVMAQAKGRETETAILPDSGRGKLSLDLLPADGLGPKGRILAAKDNFYSSFGWFVLSIPVTAIAYGMNNGYSEAATRSGLPSLADSGQISSYALWAAAAATATTATFMIMRLVKYLAAAH